MYRNLHKNPEDGMFNAPKHVGTFVKFSIHFILISCVRAGEHTCSCKFGVLVRKLDLAIPKLK